MREARPKQAKRKPGMSSITNNTNSEHGTSPKQGSMILRHPKTKKPPRVLAAFPAVEAN
jgi:hypothetical protein